MKILIKLLLFIIAAILAGLLVARPAIAESPTIESSVINPPYGPRKPTIDVEPATILPTRGRSYSGRNYSTEEVIQLIKDYSARYGINADLPLRIANCESGYNHLAKNKSSTASGVYQYLSSTFANTPEGKQGLSVFDAEANVRAAVRHIAINGTSPWNASKHCWSNS